MNKISKLTPPEEYRVVQASLKDPKEFRKIYDLYYTDVFRFVLSRMSDTNSTADIVSNVFYKAITKLDSFAFRGQSIKPWLIRIAYNEVMQHYRKENASQIVSIDEQNLHLIAEDTEEEMSVSIDMITPFLDGLEDEELLLLELKYFELYSYKEIGEIMELTEANARVKLHRVIKRLKKQIVKEI